MTADEARALMDEAGDQFPLVRWRDKHQRWRAARLIEVGRKWAKVRTGNGSDLPFTNERVALEKIEPYSK